MGLHGVCNQLEETTGPALRGQVQEGRVCGSKVHHRVHEQKQTKVRREHLCEFNIYRKASYTSTCWYDINQGVIQDFEAEEGNKKSN